MSRHSPAARRETPRGAEPLLSIQVLRAFAALAVVIAHTRREFDFKLQIPDPFPSVVLDSGSAGVDLFFVISGFIMVYVSETLFGRRRASLRFFLRRCVRIIPLYWAVSAVLLVYVLFRYRDLASANLSTPLIAASFAFLPYPKPDGELVPLHAVGWTLNYEMFFYLAFSIALFATRRIAVITVSVLFGAIVVIGQLSGPLPGPLGYWMDPIILEFVFGMWIAIAFREGLRLPLWGSLGLILAGIAGAVAMLATIHPGRCLQWGLPAAFIVSGLVLSRRPRSSAAPVWLALGFLGDASYALYLTHPLAMSLPRRIYPYLGSPRLYVLILLLTAISAAIFVHLLLEKPVTRILQRLVSAIHPANSPSLPADTAPTLSPQAGRGLG